MPPFEVLSDDTASSGKKDNNGCGKGREADKKERA